tara:strand:- start:905 stop:1912 length:1008 start_codon:yes stop_codon:yes gene_type:complete
MQKELVKYIFVNTYICLIQALFFYKNESNLIIVIDADYFTNAKQIEQALIKNNFNAILDKKDPFLRSPISKNISKFLIFNYFRFFPERSIEKIYYNGDPSTKLRLKALSSTSEIIYLDGGYQHYFKKYMHYINLFYENNMNSFTKFINKIFYGHKLNYKNTKIKKIIFMNDKLANISTTLSIVSTINKEKKIFNYVEELKNYPKAINFFYELFPEISEIILSKSAKNILIISQPFYEDGHASLEENLKVYSDYLDSINDDGHKIFLKIHPRENVKKYSDIIFKYKLNVLSSFPLEMLDLFNITFDEAISVNSTAGYLKSFNKLTFIKMQEDNEST